MSPSSRSTGDHELPQPPLFLLSPMLQVPVVAVHSTTLTAQSLQTKNWQVESRAQMCLISTIFKLSLLVFFFTDINIKPLKVTQIFKNPCLASMKTHMILRPWACISAGDYRTETPTRLAHLHPSGFLPHHPCLPAICLAEIDIRVRVSVVRCGRAAVPLTRVMTSSVPFADT